MIKLKLRPYQERANQLLKNSFQKGNQQTGKKYRKGWIVHQIKQRENPWINHH